MFVCPSLTTSLIKKQNKKTIDTSLGCSHCLKYNVILYGAEKTTPEQLARRIYADHKHKGYKKRLPEDRSLDENIPIWGKLLALNLMTENEKLQGEKTTIGRSKDCNIVIASNDIASNVISRQRKSSLPSLFFFLHPF